MEIAIGKYTQYNGSKNKAVAVIFDAPAVTPTTGKSNQSHTLHVTANASCGNYNHVGNDWTTEFYVNGSQVSKNTEVTLSSGDSVTVSATITEIDKTPDIGTASETYTVTNADLEKGFTITLNVNVRENGGRYSGNTAKWQVTFTFKP